MFIFLRCEELCFGNKGGKSFKVVSIIVYSEKEGSWGGFSYRDSGRVLFIRKFRGRFLFYFLRFLWFLLICFGRRFGR